MAHAHNHSMNRSGYYLEQLCTIGACGALSIVTILMWQQGKLKSILAESFFLPVLYGGIGLLALVIIRGVSLWFEAGQSKMPVHDHEHHHHEHEGPCDHDAGKCDHDHEHAWTPAKYAVLLLPIALFLLGQPQPGFSKEGIQKMLGNSTLEGGTDIAAKDGATVLGFRELADAAHEPSQREHFEGRTGQLKGMFMRLGSDKEFTLFRLKMRCCAADAVPVQVRIISPTNINHVQDRDWVDVKGRIGFRKIAGMEKYMPILLLESADSVQKSAAEYSEFDQ